MKSRWLDLQQELIRYGKIGITVFVHAGIIQRIEKTIFESVLDDSCEFTRFSEGLSSVSGWQRSIGLRMELILNFGGAADNARDQEKLGRFGDRRGTATSRGGYEAISPKRHRTV